jgi:serine/threonine-protein kinase
MAPEQTLGQAIDGRADVYSLGCLMYRLLTGALPFEAATPVDIMAKHSYEEPVPPRDRRTDLGISSAVEAIVLKAMAKKAEDRFPSMRAMGDEIRRCRLSRTTTGQHTISSGEFRMDDHPPSEIRRLKRKLPAVAAGAAALAVVATVIYFLS